MLQQNNIKSALVTFAVSLLLAAVIWVVYNMSQTYSDLVTVSVVAKSNIEGRSRTSMNEVPVVAKCKGTGTALITMQLYGRHNTIPVEFDAADFKHKEGDTYVISDKALSKYFKSMFSNYLILESFATSGLEFRFAQENFKKLPVIPVSFVSYAPQYTSLGGVKLMTDSVFVYGEPSKLEKVERILTSPVTRNDLKKSIRGEANLEIPVGTRLSQTSVDYLIDVVRYVELSDKVSISTRNVPAGYSFKIYPSSVNVVARCIFPCNGNPIEKMNFYIDYDEFVKSLTGKCAVRHDSLPDGVIDFDIDPQFCECMIGDN